VKNNYEKEIEELKLFIISYFKKFHKVPSMSLVTDKFKYGKDKAFLYYRTLQERGFLKRNYANYQVEEKKLEIPVIPEEEKKEKKEISFISPFIIFLIRICMGIIGIGASVLSIYYTGIWLNETLPVILAFSLSTFMILFSVMCFEVVIIFWKRKLKVLIPFFIILWLIVIVFSMTSTVAGQYNQRIKNENENKSNNFEKIKKKNESVIYNKEERDLEKRIIRKEGTLEAANDILNSFDMEKKEEFIKEYNDAYWKMKNEEKELNSLYKKLELKREEIKKFNAEEVTEVGMSEETEIQSASFYVWVSTILKIEPIFIQFWLSTFPAIFIDIIASLGLAVSMFLKKEGKKNV